MAHEIITVVGYGLLVFCGFYAGVYLWIYMKMMVKWLWSLTKK